MVLLLAWLGVGLGFGFEFGLGFGLGCGLAVGRTSRFIFVLLWFGLALG